MTSGYGYHLVYVSGHTEGRKPELAEVREDVEREWRDSRRREKKETFYDELLGRYRISIRWPEAMTEAGAGR